MPVIELEHTTEIAFGAHGGAELFFADVDGDGQLEILAYQGPGVFGTRIFHGLPAVAAHRPESTCLSAKSAQMTAANAVIIDVNERLSAQANGDRVYEQTRRWFSLGGIVSIIAIAL